jgi:hypothetical protein
MGRSDVPRTSLRIADVVTFLAVRQVGTITRAARDTADYNLERKPFVFSVFSLLADATR